MKHDHLGSQKVVPLQPGRRCVPQVGQRPVSVGVGEGASQCPVPPALWGLVAFTVQVP